MQLFSTKRWQRRLAGAWGIAASLVAAVPVLAEEGSTVGRTSWWLPENVFPAAEPIDALFYFILYLTGAICIAVFVVLIAFLIKYRYKAGRQGAFIHGNTRLEVVWTLVPTVILAFTAVFSQATWSNIKRAPEVSPDENMIEMEVVGRQFAWYYHYPGADGKLGPRDPKLVDPQSSDPDELIGLDRSNPIAKDDLVTPNMVIPVNTKVLFKLSSVDVLHSFFLPNFRVKQDAVPGLNGQMWIQSTKTSAQVIGTSPDESAIFGYAKPFDIVCAELCGQGHFKMRGKLYVVTQEQYEAFLAEEASYLDFGDEDEEDYY